MLTDVGRVHARAIEARGTGRIAGRLVVLWDWPHLDSRFAVTGRDSL
jgi:hypothetical protein